MAVPEGRCRAVETFDLPLRATPMTADLRGFVFVDLRGHTSYLARRGPDAGDELLSRYRRIVGDVLARHGAAAVATEGDGIYAVLRTPGAAIGSARAVLRATSKPIDRGAPIAIGVGVHAARTTDRELRPADGPGHIAARLAGLASSGEILATGDVRGLSRGLGRTRFVERAIGPLRGVAHPVDVFSVVDDEAPVGVGAGRVARLVAASALVGMLGLVAAVGVGGLRPGGVADPIERATGPVDGPAVTAPVDGPVLTGPTDGPVDAPVDEPVDDPGVLGLPPGGPGGPGASPGGSPAASPEPTASPQVLPVDPPLPPVRPHFD
jgi:class 3 adenylate cyclase